MWICRSNKLINNNSIYILYATHATGSLHWSWFHRIQPTWPPFSPSNAWTRQSRVPKTWRSRRKFVTVCWAEDRPHHFSEIRISQHINVCGRLWRAHDLQYSRAAISRVSNVWSAEKEATHFWWNPLRLNMWSSAIANWHKSAIYSIRRAMVLRCAKVSLQFIYLFTWKNENFHIYFGQNRFAISHGDQWIRTKIARRGKTAYFENSLVEGKTHRRKILQGELTQAHAKKKCEICLSFLFFIRTIRLNQIRSQMSLD